jgi:hypothetical protein
MIISTLASRCRQTPTSGCKGFTDLIATALANAEARGAVAAARRGAGGAAPSRALVAQDTRPARDLRGGQRRRVDRAFRLDPATFEIAMSAGSTTAWTRGRRPLEELEVVPLGSRWPPDELFAPTHGSSTGRSARIGAR